MLGFPPARKDPNRRAAPRLELLEDRTTPALFANPDTFSAQIGRVLTVPSPGVLANDFSDTFPGAVLSAQLVVTAKYVGSNQPLPANSLFLNPNGSFTFIAPSQVPAGVSQVQFTYQASNGQEPPAQAVVTINLTGNRTKLIATGADAGGGPHVRVFEVGSSVVKYNFFPYEPSFTGGVRVAVGDVNGDGVDDIVTIPAEGGGPRLRVFDGVDGSPIIDTFAFDPAFRGGGYVTVGDFNGDGIKDIIVAAGTGGGPRVQAFTLVGNNLRLVADFFAYDPSLRTGVRVAAGDLKGIGRDEIVTAPGPGASPEVRAFDFPQITGRLATVPYLDFMAADGTNTDGVWVATGNVRGNGLFDIITGSGGGAGVVRVFDGRNGGLVREFDVPSDETPTGGGAPNGPTTFAAQTPVSGSLLAPSQAPSSLLPSSPGSTSIIPTVSGGVRVAATDWDGDGLDDIVTANGPLNVPRVRVFNTASGLEITNILAYSPLFLGGVNVAASH